MLWAELAEDTGWWMQLTQLISIPLLIVLNGVFVAAQFSLVALRPTRVEEMVRQAVPGAGAVAHATRKLDELIGVTQVGTVLVGLLLGWLGEPAVSRLLQPALDYLGQVWHPVALHSVASVLTLVLITALSVVFSELIPKTIGLQTAETTALVLARPLLAFTWLASPFVRLLDSVGDRVLRLFGYRVKQESEDVHSLEELAILIEDTEEAGLLDEDQSAFVLNVFRLSEKRVGQTLVPLEKTDSLDLHLPAGEVLEQARTKTHTRMPVFIGQPRHVVGIANTKELLRRYLETGEVSLDQVMYPPQYLETEDSLAKAMRQLKKSGMPMAVVRDATGIVRGMITLEDVLEEIVGDLEDEHDRPIPKLSRRFLQSYARPAARRAMAQLHPSRSDGKPGAGDRGIGRSGNSSPLVSDGEQAS